MKKTFNCGHGRFANVKYAGGRRKWAIQVLFWGEQRLPTRSFAFALFVFEAIKLKKRHELINRNVFDFDL